MWFTTLSAISGLLMCAHASAIPSNPQLEDMMGLLEKRDFAGLQLTGCDLSKAILPKSDGFYNSSPPLDAIQGEKR